MMSMLPVSSLLSLDKFADFHENWYEDYAMGVTSMSCLLLTSISNDMAGVRTTEAEVTRALL
jgi:hypothetical protein